MNKLFNTCLYRCSIYIYSSLSKDRWKEHFNGIEDSIICSNLHDDIAHLKFYFCRNGWNLKWLELKVLDYCDTRKKNINYSIEQLHVVNVPFTLQQRFLIFW